MALTDTNIYASCRRRTGMTQEGWAEALDVSVESVKRYETDVRIPPLHIVKAMADLSGDESLAYRFLAKDGIISEAERPLYAEILDELTGIITAYYQLKFYTEDGKR